MPSDSTQSSSSNSTSRLHSISNHIMGSAGNPSVFTADVVPQAPEDPLFGLMAAYRKDTSNKKVDLGIGAYRDNNAKPWILPVVKRVRPIMPELRQISLTSRNRPMKYYAKIQTSTTNICQSQAYQTSHQQRRSSSLEPLAEPQRMAE